jgi:hypothetical protein
MSLMRMILLIGLALPAGMVSADTTIDLTDTQRATLYREGMALYDKALAMGNDQVATANDLFARSAEKLAMVADSGPVDGAVRYNLATAQLRAGQVGRAIANYQRARQALGSRPELLANLARARAVRDGREMPSDASGAMGLADWNEALPMAWRFWLAGGAWAAFWLAGGAAVLIRRVRWRWVLAPLAMVWVLAGASVGWQLYSTGESVRGVIVEPGVLRSGNGLTFEPVDAQPAPPGSEFVLLRRNGDWLKVKLTDGRTGWLPRRRAELIEPWWPGRQDGGQAGETRPHRVSCSDATQQRQATEQPGRVEMEPGRLPYHGPGPL